MLVRAIVCLATVALTMLAAADAELLRDGSFEGEPVDVWEFRYLWKASTQGLPTWTVAVREEEGGRGGYLDISGDRGAAGTVLFGQRVTVPPELALLTVAFDYQTYCGTEARSGMVDVACYAVEDWDALPREPRAGDGPEPLLHQPIVPQGNDVTEWTHAEAFIRDARETLAPLAGREVVFCLMWATWHEGTEEWARFDKVSLHTTGFFAERGEWPGSCYDGRPIRLRAEVVSLAEQPVVELQFRQEGSEEWQTAPMAGSGEGVVGTRYVGELAEPQPGRIECRVAVKAGDRGIVTEPHTIDVKPRRQHPHVFYSPAETEEMKRRIASYEWAAAIFEGVKGNADAWLERDDDPPQEGGGWSHDYTCQECGARLQFDIEKPHEHYCRTCKEYRTGTKLDRVWIATRHGQFCGAAHDLALTYALTGDERHARRARDIMLDYVELYPTLPVNTGPAGRGRIMAQSLSECSWLLRFMRAYDLLYNGLSDDDRTRIEEEFIRPDVHDRFPYGFGLHNIQCWHNACYAAAGYLLGDDSLIERSLAGSIGFREQIRRGILDDGMWFERSIGYHYYTLSALIEHCEAARHNGLDLHRDERIKRMFLLPLRMSQPNLVPPSLSDQGYMSSRISADPIERALGWYGDDEFARVLAYLYDTGTNRRGQAALQYGEELAEVAAAPALPSANLTGTGAAILRDGEGEDARWVLLRYGQHGGGHGHPDKLEIILYGLGRTLFPDLGNPGYGAALHGGYYKTTPGHNTVTLGLESQGATTGQCLAFAGEGPVQAAVAESSDAYEDAVLRRTVVLGPGYVADVYRVETRGGTTIDYILRCFGQLALTPAGSLAEGKLGEERGYRYMELVQRATPAADGTWQATWALGEPAGASVHVTGLAAEGCELLHVKAPGIPGRERLDTLVLRRAANSGTFALVHQLLRTGQRPRRVSSVSGGIAIGDDTDRQIILSPDLASLQGEPVAESSSRLRVLQLNGSEAAEQLSVGLSLP